MERTRRTKRLVATLTLGAVIAVASGGIAAGSGHPAPRSVAAADAPGPCPGCGFHAE